jgi:outer membrane protein TolC
MINMHMGRPLSTTFEISFEDKESFQQILTRPLSKQQSEAIQNRPELIAARHQKQAASHGKDALIGKLLPEINLIASYQNNYGMGDFMLENEFFGGVMLSWNFWEWGAKFYKMKAAEAKYEKAVKSIAFAEEGIKLDVEQKRLSLEEAVKQHELAHARLKHAEENLRIEQSKYEVQESTATDLLQAQTSALRAEKDITVATMQIRVAQHQLLLAMGIGLTERNKETYISSNRFE